MHRHSRGSRRAPARFLAALALATAALSGSAGAAPPGRWPYRPAAIDPGVRVELVHLTDAVDPTGIAASPDASGRLFVTERAGRVRLLTRGRVVGRPYLDISARVLSGDERGLLSIAFHPRFARNGYFYVVYTNGLGDVRLSRFRANPRAAVASASSEAVVLEVGHRKFANHNGGQVAFGPDGYLYLSVGDGGSGGDPDGNAQDRTSLLGKVLRLDVNRGSAGRHYAIPPTNPYARHGTARPEIWHYGLRNPWRFSFDRFGSQWIADVGQQDREELNLLGRGVGNHNFGWDCREGKLDVSRRYGGSYVYADFCSGEIWALAHLRDGRWKSAQVGTHPGNLSSFGQSRTGELFATDLRGGIYRLTARRR
jgi:glucose/arabinose dehydrogenase